MRHWSFMLEWPKGNTSFHVSSHSTQHQLSKTNTGIVLMPCCAWKCVPTAVSSSVHISEVHGCHEFSVRVTKLFQGLVSHQLTAYFSIFNLFLTLWVITILSNGWKPDNFEPNSSLKLSFTNIWSLGSIFVESKSFLELNSPDILDLCKTNLDDSIDFGNFSVRGYLPLIQKDSITHMHGIAVYVKQELPFAQDLSLENSADSYLCFRLALLHSVSYFFFLYRSSSSSLCTVFDSISSNIDEVLSISRSANV